MGETPRLFSQGQSGRRPMLRPRSSRGGWFAQPSPRIFFGGESVAILLRLTNSDDFNERIAAPERAPQIAAAEFQDLTGELMTVEQRSVWPSPRLPGLLATWLEDSQPDIVLLRCAAYWVTFRSVPLRVRRLLGPAGKPLVAVGNRSSQVHWLAESGGYRLARKALLRTFGGDTNFAVAEVIDVIEACIRRVLALEGPLLIVRGPQAAVSADTSQRSRAWAERRRGELDSALRSVCEKYHVDYICPPAPQAGAEDDRFYFRDLVHATADLHRIRGREEGQAMARAWIREHAQSV